MSPSMSSLTWGLTDDTGQRVTKGMDSINRRRVEAGRRNALTFMFRPRRVRSVSLQGGAPPRPSFVAKRVFPQAVRMGAMMVRTRTPARPP